MKVIDKNDKIFSKEEFLKDKYMFNIIYLNLDSEDLCMVSDSDNYLICRGKENLPIWIWTSDKISDEKLGEASNMLDKYIISDNLRFTAKRNFYNYLKKKKYKFLDSYYFEMGALYVLELITPKKCEGSLEKVKLNELFEISKNWHNATKEMVDTKDISFEQAEIEVKEMFETGNLYCWKNNEGKIVSMLEFEKYYGQAKITHVYTPVEERKKGYASNMVYEVSKMLLDEGVVPVLYTNYNYIPSNKVYKNIGYKTINYLINFRCSLK